MMKAACPESKLKRRETYSTDGNKLTWDTDGKDIYYQGTTEQALPVSMKFTYYLTVRR